MNTSRKILISILILVLVSAGSGYTLFTYIFPSHLNRPVTRIEEKSSIDEITLGVIKKAESPLDMDAVLFLAYSDSLLINYEMKNIRNPFVTKSTVSKSSKSRTKTVKRNYRPRIIVNGIISDASKPYAILNGEVYVVGDIIKGYTVQSIQDSTVILHNRTDLFTVKYRKN